MEAANAPDAPPAARRQRSPSYPAVGLEQALDRAGELYRNFGRSPAHVEVALKALGYGPKSGGGRVLVAALKKFGLLSDQGNRDRRQVQLTPLALRIILDPRADSSEREQAIRTAAMTPTIYRELWDRYGPSLPGDDTLAYYLRVERAFTDSAVREFVPQFRATVDFARLAADGGTVPSPDEDKTSPPGGPGIRTPEDHMTPPGATADPPVQDPPADPVRNPAAPLPVNVNLATGGWATLQVSERMTEAEWDQLLAVLNAMKPGLIKRPGE